MRIRDCAALILLLSSVVTRPSTAQTSDWQSDWAVDEGLALEVHSEGFALPASIAVVPEPGPAPDDPLYFVAELEGAVKVVTRSGEVRTFAEDFFVRDRPDELPSVEAESGMAGICLAPREGYVFVTYTYSDAQGALRNAMHRFESEPGRFSTQPTGSMSIGDFLRDDVTSISHQIGNCQVEDGLVYFGAGDGHRADQAQQLESSLGKVFRMTLDGRPAAANPYPGPDEAGSPRPFLWAYGLRNPFGLSLVGDRLFVVDNGPSIDRFISLERGRNYLWDGSDASIAAAADLVFFPSVAPVQMTYYDGDGPLPPGLASHFLIATAGGPARLPSEAPPNAKALLGLPYDLDEGHVTGPPRPLLRYVGDGLQSVVGVALGSDGVYVVPLFPMRDGRSVVLRLFVDPEDAWPTRFSPSPTTLIARYGCEGCHGFEVADSTFLGPTLHGPTLTARLEERLSSENYRARLRAMDSVGSSESASLAQGRQQLLAAPPDSAVWTYVYLQLRDPRFATTTPGMPTFNLPDEEARILADHLLGSAPPPATGTARLFELLRSAGLVPSPLRYRHLAFAVMLGSLSALGAAGAVALLLRFRRKTPS